VIATKLRSFKENLEILFNVVLNNSYLKSINKQKEQ
jgi:hypothetical protein